jgi:hypothetical protein
MNLMKAAPLVALLATAAQAQLATVRTSGQYEPNGTVLYSVYVATGAEKISEVAIGGTVPLGTRFIESVDLPAGVSFEGVRDNVAVWGIKEIGADRLIGPFTFRTKPDGAAAIIAEPSAAVSYQKPEPGLADYAGTQTLLAQLEPAGSVTFDARGTLNEKNENAPIYVGKTGVLLYVPDGAVRTQTTISIERQEIDESRLPKTEVPLWWCGLYKVSISPSEAATKQFSFAFPNRRQVTPVRAIGFGGGGFGAVVCDSFPFGQTVCRSAFAGGGFGGGGFGGGQFGFGVPVAARAASTVTSAQLSAAFNVPTTLVSAISDGTSNTIIAILIGKR